MALTEMLRAVAANTGLAPAPAIGFGLMACLLAGLEWVKRVATEAMGLDVARDIRLHLLEALLRQQPLSAASRSHASTMLPFMGDLTALRQWISDGVARGMVAVLIMVCLSAWIGFQSLSLSLVVLAPMCLAMVAMLWICRPLHDSARRQRTLRGQLATLIDDRVRNAITVRAMGGEEREMKRMARRIDGFNRISLQRAGHVGRLRSASALGGQAIVLAGFGYGALLVRGGEIDLHHLVGLMSLAGLMATALSDVARAAELTVPGLIAWQRLRGRMSEHVSSTQPAGGRRRAETGLTVETLMTAGTTRPFSARVGNGEVVLLDGGSSAQRTGLLLSLAGLAGPVAARVRMDGRPVHGLKPSRRRNLIGIASPAVPLLRAAMATNLAYRVRSRARPSAEELARDLGPVTESVASLVRAMAGRPRLLLLDGVDAGLTADQQEVMVDYLRHWPGVVVMTAATRGLADCATRHWRLSDDGLVEEAPPAPTPVTAPVVQLFPHT